MSERAFRLALLGGAVALVGVHLWLSRGRDELLLADGTGYLANARWIAGKAGATWQGAAAFYHAGWSLLVAPVYLFTTSPDAVHAYVLVLNAVLGSLSAVACALVGRRVFALSPSWSLLAGAVAGTYPAVLLQSGFEWSESLYFLLFPLFALAAHRLLSRPSVASAVAAGLVAAALNATHPKGLGVVVATVFVVAILGWRRLVPRREAAVVIGAAVVGFAATRLLHAALLDALYDDSAAAIEGGVLARVKDPALVWATFARFWGQTWYLTVASVGLVPLGVWAWARHVDRRVAALVLGAAALMLAASSLQMSDGTRVDHVVYGRYDEGFVPVLLVGGVAAAARLRSAVLAGLGGASFAVLGVLALLFNGADRFTGDVMPLNVLGVLVYERSRDEIEVLVVTALAIAVLALVAAAHHVRRAAALAVLAAFFVASSASVDQRTLRSWSGPFMAATEIPDVVRAIDAAEPVWVDRDAYDVDAINAYQLELTDVTGIRFYESSPPARAQLVVADTGWAAPAGARLAFAESVVYDAGLWVLPGPLQTRLAAELQLLPEQTSAPLPQAARLAAELELDGNNVRVRHAGTKGVWLPVGPIPGVVEGTVRLGARWYDSGGVVVANETAELPRVMRPGDEVDVRLRLDPVLPDGEYTLRVALRQEGIAWWDESAVERQVRVRS